MWRKAEINLDITVWFQRTTAEAKFNSIVDFIKSESNGEGFLQRAFFFCMFKFLFMEVMENASQT